MALIRLYRWLTGNRISFIILCLLFVGAQVYCLPDYSETALWELGGRIALGIGTAVLLQYLNRQFVLIRSKTILPSLFYLLFLLAYTPVLRWEDLAVGLILLLCLFLLFATYQQPRSQRKALNIAILQSIAILLWYPAILLFPLIWFGMYRLQSFNIKTLSAMLAGIFLVFLFLFAWSIYKNDIGIFLGFLPDWQSFIRFQVPALRLSEYIFLGFLFILYIICIANQLSLGRSDKIKAKVIFGYLSFLAGALFLFYFLFPDWDNTWLSLLFIPLALLYSHLFARIIKKLPIYFFFFTVLLFIAKLIITILLPTY